MTVSFIPDRQAGPPKRTIRFGRAESLSSYDESGIRLRHRNNAFYPAGGELPDLFGRVSTSATRQAGFVAPAWRSKADLVLD